jgi:hypothetical protein
MAPSDSAAVPATMTERGPYLASRMPDTGPAGNSAIANGAMVIVARRGSSRGTRTYGGTPGRTRSGTACVKPTTTPTARAAPISRRSKGIAARPAWVRRRCAARTAMIATPPPARADLMMISPVGRP